VKPTQRRFSLDTNLTKWLSKCEGSLLKAKEKAHNMLIMMMCCGIERHNKETIKIKEIEWKMKQNNNTNTR